MLAILLSAIVAFAPTVYASGSARDFIVIYIASCLLWCVLLLPSPQTFTKSLLILALVARASMWLTPPALSMDVYRYLWDARVSWSGTNPYAFAPSEAPGAIARPEWFEKINHPSIASIYPPHAEILFLFSGGSLVLWRAILLLSDLLLLNLLRRRVSTTLALAWAFCPLVLIEGHWSAHLEPIVGLVIFVAVVMAARSGLAGGMLALAIGLKITPFVTIPAFFRSATRRSRFALAFVVVAVGPAVLFLSSPLMPGMREFARRWIFNAPMFELVLTAVDRGGVAAWLKDLWTANKDRFDSAAISDQIYSLFYADLIARSICGVVLLALVLVIAARKKTLDWKVAHSFGFLMLLSPVVHPWYWIAGLPIFLRARTVYWIGAAMLSPVSYLLYETNDRSSWVVTMVCWGVPGLIVMGFRLRERFGYASEGRG